MKKIRKMSIVTRRKFDKEAPSPGCLVCEEATEEKSTDAGEPILS